jgi:uncharacterized coiled-coil protein SlyX
MAVLEKKVSYLEHLVEKLANAQLNTQTIVEQLSLEMKEFKDEMKEFKTNSEADRKQMNKQWGELAHKLGTVVEDIVAPNIPRIAKDYFGCDELDDFMIRRQIRHSKDKGKRREFDIIAICGNKFIINETKSTIRKEDIRDFISDLKELWDYFPKYSHYELIPIFSSLSISQDFVNYLTKNKIYAMAMKDDTMEILNKTAVEKKG